MVGRRDGRVKQLCVTGAGWKGWGTGWWVQRRGRGDVCFWCGEHRSETTSTEDTKKLLAGWAYSPPPAWQMQMNKGFWDVCRLSLWKHRTIHEGCAIIQQLIRANLTPCAGSLKDTISLDTEGGPSRKLELLTTFIFSRDAAIYQLNTGVGRYLPANKMTFINSNGQYLSALSYQFCAGTCPEFHNQRTWSCLAYFWILTWKCILLYFTATKLQETQQPVQVNTSSDVRNLIKHSPPPSAASYQGTITQTYTPCQGTENTDAHFLWRLRTEAEQGSNNTTQRETAGVNRLHPV